MSNFKKMVQARVDKTREHWSTAARHVRVRTEQVPASASNISAESRGDAPLSGSELVEERYVRELFEKLYGVRLRKVPESSTKTYDYALLDEGEPVAALEVKRFERPPMTPENGWVDEGNGRFSKTGIDKSPSRVGRAIHEKCKQLSTCSLPKMLVFVNDDGMDFLDFKDAFNGYLIYGDDRVGYYKNGAARKVAEGLIRDEKWTIDLYIWINRCEGRHSSRVDGLPLPPHAEFGPFFSFVSDAGYALARKFFGAPEVPKPAVDPSKGVPTLQAFLMREALGGEVEVFEAEFNTYTVTDIRIALGNVAKHPLRGAETSYDAITENGQVKDGRPSAGVNIRRDGDSYRFRLTEAAGEIYSVDELTMKATSFPGFVNAMRDLLRK